MKKLLILCALFTSLNSVSQNEYFTVSTILDPVASFKERGFDVGAEVEYQGAVYAAARLENFEALPGGYTSFTCAVGGNFLMYQDKWRLYSGIRGGVVHRNGASNGIFGIEVGLEYIFNNNWFIGGRLALDNRQDFIAVGYTPIWRENGYLRIGYRCQVK